MRRTKLNHCKVMTERDIAPQNFSGGVAISQCLQRRNKKSGVNRL